MRMGVWTVALLLAGTAAPAVAQDKAKYDAALEKVFQMTYGEELRSVNIDEGVQKFRASVTDKEEAKNCPALKTALEDFANQDFRQTMTTFFQSPQLADKIKGEMRKELTQADLDAFVAFADSPAGKSYLDHQRAAKVGVSRAINDSAGSLEDSPEFQKMMSDMVVKLLPVVMKCQKK